ncbi:hypothetical protein [Nocardioides zeicaulis]|uniref:Uncharacterized protein n=1 Tax=Nocardioides zeicaulis TaxID=1776857 RepID=A0ABV6DWB6_9ACTN
MALHLRALRAACVVYALALITFVVWCWTGGDWGFGVQVGLPNMLVPVNLYYLFGVTARSVATYDELTTRTSSP